MRFDLDEIKNVSKIKIKEISVLLFVFNWYCITSIYFCKFISFFRGFILYFICIVSLLMLFWEEISKLIFWRRLIKIVFI